MNPLLCTRRLICKHDACVYLLSFVHHPFGKLRRYVLSVPSTVHRRARPTKVRRVTHASGPRQPPTTSTLSGCLRTVGLRGSSKNEWVWRSLNSLSGRQRVDGTETGSGVWRLVPHVDDHVHLHHQPGPFCISALTCGQENTTRCNFWLEVRLRRRNAPRRRRTETRIFAGLRRP